MTLYGGIIALIKAPADLAHPETGPFAGPVAGRVFRDGQEPDDVAFPYVSVLYPLTDTPWGLRESKTRKATAFGTAGQADVWQELRDEKTQDALWEAVKACLDGARVPGYSSGRARVRVTGGIRVPEDEEGVIHHSIQFVVNHT